ncbi:hypothetical protein ALC57_02428 [Trachymyrmex cornetzi]|uniref:Uncharacterized protein n=1 Tax=Trachymyrmex cornetzi TaxID=471704 RepID=A0A151JPE8_9HYME|nr:hypothetical protein ALC57_02428 [Trachymyrmex cornetzi]
MSLTLTLSGKSSLLAANYFPAIDLSDNDYELGLMIFEIYHTTANVNESNNKFYFDKDDAEITIPEGSYEVRDVNEFLKRAILHSCRDALETVDNYNSDYNTDDDDDGEPRRSLARRMLNFYNLWDSRCATFEMIDILNITGEPIFDDRIVKIETHTYNLFANTTFGYSDEIRIPIHQQDLYTLPCESFLYVEGRLTVKKKNDQTPTTLVNNCVAFMFDIAIGDNRGNELILSIETWKGLYEQRWNIQNCLRNHCKGNSITVGPLTVRFSTIENAKIVCLESSDVRLMMTESTILFMFNLDKCIELAFDQLVGI